MMRNYCYHLQSTHCAGLVLLYNIGIVVQYEVVFKILTKMAAVRQRLTVV